MRKLEMVSNILLIIACGPLILVGVVLLGLTFYASVVQAWRGDPVLLISCIVAFSWVGVWVISIFEESNSPVYGENW